MILSNGGNGARRVRKPKAASDRHVAPNFKRIGLRRQVRVGARQMARIADPAGLHYSGELRIRLGVDSIMPEGSIQGLRLGG